jgi:serine/threonine protein kinase
MVDLKDGEYKACLTDFGSSHVLGGLFKDQMDEESTVWPGAIRWTAPELLSQPSGFELTTQSDMYSYGCVMFHVSAGVPSPQILYSI